MHITIILIITHLPTSIILQYRYFGALGTFLESAFGEDVDKVLNGAVERNEIIKENMDRQERNLAEFTRHRTRSAGTINLGASNSNVPGVLKTARRPSLTEASMPSIDSFKEKKGLSKKTETIEVTWDKEEREKWSSTKDKDKEIEKDNLASASHD